MRIRTSGLPPQAEVFARHLARKHIKQVLGRAVRHVARVDLRLGDLNGPRGGEDKFCTVHLRLHEGPAVHVRSRRADLAAAIHEAALRARKSLYRTLDRLRRIPRNTTP